MKKSKVFLSMLVTIIVISIVSGCLKTTNSLKSGVYATKDEMSSLIINASEETFEFQRGITSYRPDGKYVIDGNKLLLYINNEKDSIDFELVIMENHLVFQSGELAEDIIEKGTEFIYKSQD